MDRKKKWLTVLVIIVIVLLAIIAFACSRTGSTSVVPGGAGSSAGSGTSAAAVKSFFGAGSKHGTLTFISGKERKEDRVEYWVEGLRYRLTWLNADGSVRIHMISPDGTKVYHARPDEKTSVIAYTTAEKHQWIFNGPPGWKPGAGVEKDGLTAFTFSAKKLWEVEGASQKFYLEDLVVYADAGNIVKVVVRTDSNTPETEADLVTSDYVFDKPELNVAIPPAMFELPYEIVAAE